MNLIESSSGRLESCGLKVFIELCISKCELRHWANLFDAATASDVTWVWWYMDHVTTQLYLHSPSCETQILLPTQDGREPSGLCSQGGISHTIIRGGASESPNKSIDVTKLRRNHTDTGTFRRSKVQKYLYKECAMSHRWHTSGGQKG